MEALSGVCSTRSPPQIYLQHRANRSLSRRQIVLQTCPPNSDNLRMIPSRQSEGLPNHGVKNMEPYRRSLLMSAVVAVGTSLLLPEPGYTREEVSLKKFVEEKSGYQLSVPDAWERVEKAGADALFRDPMRKSTNVGVTVYPAKVGSTKDFGTVAEAREKLVAAEEAKDGFIDLQFFGERSRDGEYGALLYGYDYEIDTTRGRKRIITAVSIKNNSLYIVTGTYKCPKKGCGLDEEEQVALLRNTVDSFDVLA